VSGIHVEYEEVIRSPRFQRSEGITGNLKHFPASWADTRVVTPRWFLEQLLAEKPRDI